MMLPVALAFAGLTSLAASMHRHAGAILARRVTDPSRHRLLLLGAALLLLSLIGPFAHAPWQQPLLAWIGWLAVDALAITLAIAVRPKLLPWLAAGFIGIALVQTAWTLA